MTHTAISLSICIANGHIVFRRGIRKLSTFSQKRKIILSPLAVKYINRFRSIWSQNRRNIFIFSLFVRLLVLTQTRYGLQTGSESLNKLRDRSKICLDLMIICYTFIKNTIHLGAHIIQFSVKSAKVCFCRIITHSRSYRLKSCVYLLKKWLVFSHNRNFWTNLMS